MDISDRFASLIREASHYPSDYTMGYLRGLRRAHHGEVFGTAEGHERFLAMREGPRSGIGIGYAHGLAGADPLWRAVITTAEQIRDLCAIVGGQREAARVLGIADRTVRRWCAGAPPKSDAIEALRAEAFHRFT